MLLSDTCNLELTTQSTPFLLQHPRLNEFLLYALLSSFVDFSCIVSMPSNVSYTITGFGNHDGQYKMGKKRSRLEWRGLGGGRRNWSILFHEAVWVASLLSKDELVVVDDWGRFL
jgi:hypothetical protein